LTQAALVTYAERAVAPLDRVRRRWFSLALRSPTITGVLARRERRIAAFASLNVLVGLAAALYFPVLLFVLGPILLGVVHVAADVRYLVLRRSLARFWQHAIWIGCAALVALRVIEELHWVKDTARAETAVAAAFVLTGIGAAVQGGGSWKRALGSGAVLCAAALAAFYRPAGSRLVFLHAHNVIALVLWVYLYARRRSVLVPLVLVAVGAGVLASGVLYRVTLDSAGAQAFHLHVFTIADWIAPFARADLAVGMVVAYVFLQSVHYGVWLRFVPQEELTGQGTLTFRMSARSLFRDLGVPGVAAVAIAALAVIGGACIDVHGARSLYLSLAMFHGYLELALLAFFFVGRGGLRSTEPRAQERRA